ncbi:MAG: hypothetical protein EOP53_16335 [Sphingobacteriales bacterium]|nr:MAG: hypothetical protein EOP53_16335 [Sphingobacteriales bacterium]
MSTIYASNLNVSPDYADNSDEFKLLYNAFSGKMYSLCLRYIPNDHLAREVFLRSFADLLLNFSYLKFQDSYEDVARKVFVAGCLSFLESKEINATGNIRLSYIQRLRPLELENLQPGQQLDLIRQLPQQKRIIFNLHEVEGYRHKEISEMLNISVLHSKTILYGARLYMKSLLMAAGVNLKQ